MKCGKGMLSARDTLRFLLQAEEEVLRRYLSLLLAAGSRALRTELLPLFSSALEDRAALKELLSRPRRFERAFIPRFPRSRGGQEGTSLACKKGAEGAFRPDGRRGCRFVTVPWKFGLYKRRGMCYNLAKRRPI